MLSENFFTQARPAGSVAPDRSGAADTASLLAHGWTFAAEPTADNCWTVSGSKGEIHLASHATRLGDAFQQVEQEARLREQMACIPSADGESHRP